jgi:hypothetical protein
MITKTKSLNGENFQILDQEQRLPDKWKKESHGLKVEQGSDYLDVKSSATKSKAF